MVFSISLGLRDERSGCDYAARRATGAIATKAFSLRKHRGWLPKVRQSRRAAVQTPKLLRFSAQRPLSRATL